MKVILLQNLDRIGHQYEVKEVASGFARNYLLPKQYALIYTSQNYKIIEEKKKKVDQQKQLEMAKNNLGKIDQFILNFKEKASATGKLFAQINKKKILEKLFNEYTIKLKADDLIISQPLKEIGTHLVGIKPNYYNKIKIIIEKI